MALTQLRKAVSLHALFGLWQHRNELALAVS